MSDVPLPRRLRQPTPPPAAPIVREDPRPVLVQDTQRDERVRYAADLLASGQRNNQVIQALQETYGVSATQARADLLHVKTIAQQVLADEDNIAMFVLRKVSDLEHIAAVSLGDATAPDPESPEGEFIEPGDLARHAQAVATTRQARASAARAYVDVTKLSVQLVGARSRYYGPKREAVQGEEMTPEQREAWDNFLKDG